MAAFERFNPVNFSKNITKTISAVDAKIGRVKDVPQSLTDQLNAKTGINIIAPPLPAINANVKGLVGSVKTLVKNPSGVVKDGITATSGAALSKLNNAAINALGGAIGGAVTGDGVRGSIGGFVRGGSTSIKGAVVSTVGSVKSTVSGLASVSSIQNQVTGAVGGFAKASFGVASVAVKASLTQIKGTLRLGIKNCLQNAVSSLLSNISLPNIPFGGITPNVANGVSINGVITSVGAAGAIEINKKINKHLNAEITLLGTLDLKRATLTTSVAGKLDIIKDVKNTNFYTAKLTSEVNKNINSICNTLSPRNKKKLSRGGPIVDMVANVAADSVINNLENQIVQAASGFSAKSPKDFFNSVTGLSPTVKSVATTAGNAAASVTSSVPARAYNNIKDAINSNVPKQG